MKWLAIILTPFRLALWITLSAIWPAINLILGGGAFLSFLAFLLYGGIWLFSSEPAAFIGPAALSCLFASAAASVILVGYGALVFALEPRDRVTFYKQ